MRTIAVVGATGVLGLHIIPRLIERGYRVHAFSTSKERLQKLAFPNTKLFIGNILDRESLRPAIAGCDTVMHVATAVPRPGALKDWSLNDRIRAEGTANLISVSEEVGVKLYCQQSIAFLTNSSADEWLDENSEVRPTATTQSAVAMESLVKDSQLNWQIVRGGSLYGMGTGREDLWIQSAQNGDLRTPDDGTTYISLVHVTDLAVAFVKAIEANTAKLLVNIVDDLPVTYSELFAHIALIAGAPSPKQGASKDIPSFRITNKHAKTLLSWQPHYATYRSGLVLPFKSST